ncbi:hypothetical protein HDU92_000113 [Lobulomyces angularis]|nr:hypothetical protein HDU92_000113 [Lobulomyces angularis]
MKQQSKNISVRSRCCCGAIICSTLIILLIVATGCYFIASHIIPIPIHSINVPLYSAKPSARNLDIEIGPHIGGKIKVLVTESDKITVQLNYHLLKEDGNTLAISEPLNNDQQYSFKFGFKENAYNKPPLPPVKNNNCLDQSTMSDCVAKCYAFGFCHEVIAFLEVKVPPTLNSINIRGFLSNIEVSSYEYDGPFTLLNKFIVNVESANILLQSELVANSQFDVTTFSGNIDASSVNLQSKAIIQAQSGNINIKNLTHNKEAILLASDNGNMNIVDSIFSGNSTTLKTSSGGITSSNCKISNSVKVEVSNGDLVFNNLFFNTTANQNTELSVSTNSGNVFFDVKNFFGKYNIKTLTGNKIAQGNFSPASNNDSGEVNTKNLRNENIDIKTDTGNVELLSN